ncbi:hypothetical protein CsSME_00012310 [Camellia sinensis var. sinensis]
MKGVVMVMAVLAVDQLMVQPGQAISCGQVDGYLVPCAPYLIGGSGSPAPTCCDEVKNIKGMASTTADKRAACNCVKQAANRYSNLKDDAAQSLAAKCGVQMDIPVSWTTNCDMSVFSYLHKCRQNYFFLNIVVYFLMLSIFNRNLSSFHGSINLGGRD